MGVSMTKSDKDYDEPSVVPSKSTTGATPRQPKLLGVSSDYSIRKTRIMTYLFTVPATEQFDYLLTYLDDEAAKRATANEFDATNSAAQYRKVLDECFSLTVDTHLGTI
ncbi:hypothetical protein Smp_038920 [Schistosoma mansoni]|uniref:hypothetical protein n=1 Tax=Schistosoma mansoni TaxID=6183 RepID=UPI00022DC99C|nr:hypothetical protein Smp_038920 [Schistosoma mansoni]|eukprot:XP_018655222.1 hypothetical protein Smp_038920 [Schistosoma mansoni]